MNTDYIDLYQLHCGASAEEVPVILDTLQSLQHAGLIRGYGVSTDDPMLADLFARSPGCIAVQHELNVLHDASELLMLCEQHMIASVNRAPLAQGILTGKFNPNTFFSAEDFRGAGHTWAHYFEDGRPKAEFLQALQSIREVLTSHGRSIAQGALAWIIGRSTQTIPIAGFRNSTQVLENGRALEHGPLTP